MMMDPNTVLNSLVDDIKIQQNEVIEKMLGDAIKKGFISVRQSDPVLVKDINSDKILLRHCIIIDYLGNEKIEQLEKDLEFMKKLNADLHNSLSEFYKKTKVNTWLKNQ